MRDNKDPVWEPLAQDSPAIDDPVSWPYQWSHVARNITVKSWLFHNHVSRPSPRAPGKPATIILKITKTSALLRTENWFNRVETLISWIKHVENFIILLWTVNNLADRDFFKIFIKQRWRLISRPSWNKEI